jgi:hypothetical protein
MQGPGQKAGERGFTSLDSEHVAGGSRTLSIVGL